MLTCKQFLQELSDFLDESVDPALRAEVERHVNQCPNCWVVCDTARKTLKVFKGMDAHAVPEHVQRKLLSALEKAIADKKGVDASPPVGH